MASPVPTKNCKVCDVDLSTVSRYGGRCMKCYGEGIRRKRVDLKKKCVEFHNDKCHDCGNTFHQCQYDFHHIDEDRNNNKDKTIGHMTHACRPWKVIQEELEQCVMLCANCHRLRHYENTVDKYLI